MLAGLIEPASSAMAMPRSRSASPSWLPLISTLTMPLVMNASASTSRKPSSTVIGSSSRARAMASLCRSIRLECIMHPYNTTALERDVGAPAASAVVAGELAEQDLGLGSPLAPAGRQQAVAGAGDQLRAGPLAVAAGAPG